MGLVLYQYSAPNASAHLVAEPFHEYFLSAGAVLANLRPLAAGAIEARCSARGVERTAARNIVMCTSWIRMIAFPHQASQVGSLKQRKENYKQMTTRRCRYDRW